MSQYIFDTDILTMFSMGHPEVTAHVEATEPTKIAITIITVDEQLTGWYSEARKAKDAAKVVKAYDGLWRAVELLKRFTVLPMSMTAAQRYFDLRKQFSKLGKMDLAIAAIVLEVGGILVTRNKSDFQQVPGLVLEDWSKP